MTANYRMTYSYQKRTVVSVKTAEKSSQIGWLAMHGLLYNHLKTISYL